MASDCYIKVEKNGPEQITVFDGLYFVVQTKDDGTC